MGWNRLLAIVVCVLCGFPVPLGAMPLGDCVMTNLGRYECRAGSSVAKYEAPAEYIAPRIIGGRPKGCPHRFCGCALRRYLGIENKMLDRAWNWALMFERTSARAGAVAVWRGHVALIERMVSPDKAVMRDYNSGKGLSRIHVRSIAGAVFVNPTSKVAAAW